MWVVVVLPSGKLLSIHMSPLTTHLSNEPYCSQVGYSKQHLEWQPSKFIHECIQTSTLQAPLNISVGSHCIITCEISNQCSFSNHLVIESDHQECN